MQHPRTGEILLYNTQQYWLLWAAGRRHCDATTKNLSKKSEFRSKITLSEVMYMCFQQQSCHHDETRSWFIDLLRHLARSRYRLFTSVYVKVEPNTRHRTLPYIIENISWTKSFSKLINRHKICLWANIRIGNYSLSFYCQFEIPAERGVECHIFSHLYCHFRNEWTVEWFPWHYRLT